MIKDLFWHTSIGAWLPPKVIYRGKDLFEECRAWPWMKLLLYGVTGREFSPQQIRLFEAIWVVCCSYPDPRIWPNRVAALAGTVRSTGSLAMSASIAVSEARVYGKGPDRQAHKFITSALDANKSGKPIIDIIREHIEIHRGIAGYGRPLVHGDERIEPLMALARDLEISKTPHADLAFEVEKVLLANRYRMNMNIAMLAAALAADQGLSEDEYYHYLILSFSVGALPCYIDAKNHPIGTFFPYETGDIQYTGPGQRTWD
ncbi:MAG TPA: hypothetical protein VFX02_00080 [Gammaproteobacteria bacterium]|nr:hypothetical protein [Gammaproteobacteria bacterium]